MYCLMYSVATPPPSTCALRYNCKITTVASSLFFSEILVGCSRVIFLGVLDAESRNSENSDSQSFANSLRDREKTADVLSES